MSRRAAAAADTRRRIIDAALLVYEREGFGAASLLAIAREADVSPQTVANHFPDGDELLTAAVEALQEQLRFPSLDSIAAAGDQAARVKRLSRELARFYEESERWYVIYAREPELPALEQAAGDFYRRVAELTAAALGPASSDKRTLTMVLTLTGPQTYGNLRRSGMSARAAADAVSEVLLAWLSSRPKTKAKKPRKGG